MTNNIPTVDFSKMYEPIQKLIDLNINKFQETVAAQSEATKNFVDQTDARIKTATEIKDFDALASFMKEQTDIARTNMEKLVADSKMATEEVVAYGNEVQKILNDSFSSSATTAQPAKKSAKK